MKTATALGSFRIHQKTILVFIFLMLLVYALGVYVSFDVQRQVREEYQNSVAMRMNYLAREIDKDVSHLQTQQHQLKLDANMQKLLLFPNTDDMGAITSLVKDVNRRISSIQNSSIYTGEVVVCLTRLGRSLSSASFYRPKNDGDRQVMMARPESGVLTIDGDGVYLIETLSQRFKYASPEANVCYIRLSMPALSQALAEAASSGSISVYLANGSDMVLGEGGEIPGFEAAYDADATDGQAERTVTVGGERYLMVRQHIESLAMHLVACIPERTFAKIMMKNQIWLVILTTAAIVSFVAFALFANRMINRPINRFVQAFREVEHDNLDVKVEHHATDEFAYLYNTFNNMTSRLKTSIRQVYQHEIATQRAELKQLQSQINPHFLYNSFFHIYRMCKMDDIDGVADFSLKLSNFYQYITRSGADIVPLEMEYRHAADYIDIQSVRYGSRIQVLFEPLPEQYRELAVPRLMLQPVLENAYLHGSEEREERTTIRVHARGAGNYLCIVVEDDGTGMDEADMQRLSAMLMDPMPQQETTGLINVSRRLHIRYGGQSGVSVSASASGGLRVELRIRLE